MSSWVQIWTQAVWCLIACPWSLPPTLSQAPWFPVPPPQRLVILSHLLWRPDVNLQSIGQIRSKYSLKHFWSRSQHYSYLNFHVLPCCSGDQGCALLSYGLHKVTAGEREEAGRTFIRMYCFTFSIHHQGDDSILVKIHWTPIKSDGCYHWKLKSCQVVISTNAGPRNGGLWANDGLLGIFLVILFFFF